MDVVHSKGTVAKQAHVGIPEGTFEEEHGRETFFGRASHLYRSHPPTAWTRIEGTLRPRALNLNELKPEDMTDAALGWQLVASNEEVRLFVSRRANPMEYFLRDAAGDFEVRVKRDQEFTSLWFKWHPLDVVGWQGDLCPVKLNILQHRPVYSPSYHMPPSAHCTFANDGFVICSFVPRPLEEDPQVLKVPFYHANIDADEVLFYHSGNYFSRADIDTGYLTLHPQGVHHGPQPAAIEASKSKERTDEVAVMVETENPLVLSSEAEAVVLTEYETSWARGMGLLEER